MTARFVYISSGSFGAGARPCTAKWIQGQADVPMPMIETGGDGDFTIYKCEGPLQSGFLGGLLGGGRPTKLSISIAGGKTTDFDLKWPDIKAVGENITIIALDPTGGGSDT